MSDIEYKIHCGTPMVATIMFSGAEYYCVICGETQGIFGPAETVPETRELIDGAERNDKLFKQAAGDLIPMGAMFPNCEQCRKEQHGNHASQEDLKKSDEAHKLLANGILREPQNATN